LTPSLERGLSAERAANNPAAAVASKAGKNKNAGRSKTINGLIRERKRSMQHNVVVITLSLAATLTLGIPAKAADLPQSGTIKTHSAQKGTFTPVEVAPKHSMGVGTNWGITYNEAGSGPLNEGVAMCTYAINSVNSADTLVGDCAFGEPGGADKIFVAYSANGDAAGGQGSGPITGGIGKYAGISGKWTWQCKYVELAQGLIACTQQFNYQLK
jgi:hypothetical protein